MHSRVLRPTRGRVALLDELRGLFILLMVFYHGFYDVAEIFGIGRNLFYSPFMQFMQLLIAGDFVLISGAACRFSQNNLKRGFITFGCGMLLTIATAVAMPSQIILFGVLHLLGLSMVVFACARPLLDRVHPTVGLFVCTLLFLGTYFVPHGLIGFPPYAVPLSGALYQYGWMFWLGFPGPGFFSSDYFSVLPWLFFFLAGSFAGVYLKEGRLPGWVYRTHVPWLAKVGRHTIWIYLLHQPVLYVAISGIFFLLRS